MLPEVTSFFAKANFLVKVPLSVHRVHTVRKQRRQIEFLEIANPTRLLGSAA